MLVKKRQPTQRLSDSQRYYCRAIRSLEYERDLYLVTAEIIRRAIEMVENYPNDKIIKTRRVAVIDLLRLDLSDKLDIANKFNCNIQGIKSKFNI